MELRHVELDDEVRRLLKARHESKIEDSSYLPPVSEVSTMTHNKKIEILAEGIIDNWYGRRDTAEVILSNLFKEANDKAFELVRSRAFR